MPNITISATELKNNTASVLNNVYYGDDPVIIERHGKPLVKMIPIKEKNTSNKEIENKLASFFGSIPDMPDVENTSERTKDLNIG